MNPNWVSNVSREIYNLSEALKKKRTELQDAMYVELSKTFPKYQIFKSACVDGLFSITLENYKIRCILTYVRENFYVEIHDKINRRDIAKDWVENEYVVEFLQKYL